MTQTAVNWSLVQQRLGKLYSGKIDGVEGPLSWIGVVDFAAPTQPYGADATTLRGRKLAEVAHQFGLTTAERIAGFLSNTTHETGDYRTLRENLYYTSATQIRATWPTRFANDAQAQPFVRNPESLANKVYARPAEGNTLPGDGWAFRGGGDYQITFRNGYRAAGAALNLPLEAHPELIEAPAAALQAGLFYFQSNNLGRFYDAGQPMRARALANSGNPDFPNPIGWPDVQLRHNRLMGLLT